MSCAGPPSNPTETAIQAALDHALAYGDDRTAFDLATILRGMSSPGTTVGGIAAYAHW